MGSSTFLREKFPFNKFFALSRAWNPQLHESCCFVPSRLPLKESIVFPRVKIEVLFSEFNSNE
jgi:hypothetical protein